MSELFLHRKAVVYVFRFTMKIKVIEVLARQAAVAINNAKAYEAEHNKADELEAVLSSIQNGVTIYHEDRVAFFLERKFDEDDVKLLGAVARPVAIAIDNARLYAIERNIADTLQEALLVMPEEVPGVDFGYLIALRQRPQGSVVTSMISLRLEMIVSA